MSVMELTERDILLVRHAAVADKYRGLCYGQSDVELSAAGEAFGREWLKGVHVTSTPRIYHSDLQRTRFLAELLAGRFQVEPTATIDLRERHFGEWELKSWDTIHAQVGDEILGMVHAPETYRPGGGETTFELRDRVLRWWHHLPAGGPVIVITHGGTIAALMGTLCDCQVETWPELIPVCGAAITINRRC